MKMKSHTAIDTESSNATIREHFETNVSDGSNVSCVEVVVETPAAAKNVRRKQDLERTSA